MRKCFVFLLLIHFCRLAAAQQTDTIPQNFPDTALGDLTKKNIQVYNVGGGKQLMYEKPRRFSFITKLPRDTRSMVCTTFNRRSVKPLVIIAASTAVLLITDQMIADNFRDFCRKNRIYPDEMYSYSLDVNLGGKPVGLFKTPGNINTFFYQMGQGFPSLLIGAGLFTYGKIHKDNRALSTANQLAESFILMGVTTQVLKRISGRQSPSESRVAGGLWKPFPSFKSFQTHTANYDAFPSGHLATLMSTVTTLALNYPEKKWIKPVGYSLTGLVGLSMINNQVHWSSDYPLAIGLGYLCAKVVAMGNQKIFVKHVPRQPVN